jgi:general secretion pathway protein G
MPRRLNACDRGFTLIEMIAVLAIVAVLVAMSWPLAELTARRERESELRRDLWQIRDALDAYKKMADAGLLQQAPPSGYPPNLQILASGVTTSTLQTVYFLRRIPQDPFAPDAADGGWGLRSYRSAPDRPEAGDDVFDVYSQSTATGLDGIALRQW